MTGCSSSPRCLVSLAALNVVWETRSLGCPLTPFSGVFRGVMRTWPWSSLARPRQSTFGWLSTIYKMSVKLNSYFEADYSSLPEKCKLKPPQRCSAVNLVDVNESGAQSLHRGAAVNLGLPGASRAAFEIYLPTSPKLPDNGLSPATL